ncbi:hypothetical protein XI09_19905 [Bradyrhizobium sp. CCBAU 11386]|nr:hypothetical protein [Bradyrhizobium sp. CCBAU 11386]
MKRNKAAGAIDHDLAGGLHDADTRSEQPSGLAVLLTCRPLLVFAICVLLFHLSNAAMLPLVGQKLALQDKNMGTSLMSACIVAAQVVMVPFAMLVGAIVCLVALPETRHGTLRPQGKTAPPTSVIAAE